MENYQPITRLKDEKKEEEEKRKEEEKKEKEEEKEGRFLSLLADAAGFQYSIC